MVEVDPKNVVAVPNDYNGTKMRVCEYTVICEVEKPEESVYLEELTEGDEINIISNCYDSFDDLLELGRHIIVCCNSNGSYDLCNPDNGKEFDYVTLTRGDYEKL